MQNYQISEKHRNRISENDTMSISRNSHAGCSFCLRAMGAL